MSVGLFLASIHNKHHFILKGALLYFKLCGLNGTNIYHRAICAVKHEANSKNSLYRTPFEYYKYLDDVTETPYSNCSLR